MKARSCVTLPGAGHLSSPFPPFLSPPPTVSSGGAEGTSTLPSPLPCRWIRPRCVVPPLPVVVARVLLPDPRGRPRLPPVLLPPSTALVDIDAVALNVTGVTLDCDGGARECPGAVASIFSAVLEFLETTDTTPPGSVCSLPPGSSPDARAAPFSGATTATERAPSRAGSVASAVPLTAAAVALV